MNVDLTKPQAEIYQSTAKAICAVAGFGAGKTQGTMIRMISTMIDHPTADMLYAAPTIPLIRDILWAKLDEFLPQIGIQHTTNKSESIVYLHGLGKIFCRSMDNPARLVGFEVLDAFMDELDILPTDKALEVFRKIKARCRQMVENKDTGKIKKSQQYVTTTPEGYKATYELFKKNPIRGSHLVQMSTYSNPYLPDDYIDDLLASYPAQLIKAYLMGEFVNLEAAAVWSGFNQIGNVLDVGKESIVVPGEPLHVGVDFNVGRGCSVVYVERNLRAGHPQNPLKDENWPILIAADEIYNTFDTPDTVRVLEERYSPDIFKNKFCYPDATGQNRKSVNATVSDLWLMKKAGYIIRKKNKNPSIKDRVTSSNAAFCNAYGQRKIYVHEEKCPHYVQSLTQQVYDKNGLPEKGKGKFDDLTDAGTYPIYYKFPVKRSYLRVGKLGGL